MRVADQVDVKLECQREGKVMIAIDPGNIILSKKRLESSALNGF